jgi:hypothetical protein
MACTACLVCLISTVSGCSKKAKNAVLLVGAEQTLSNLYFLLISMELTYLLKNIVAYQHKVQYIKTLRITMLSIVTLKICLNLHPARKLQTLT